VIQTEINHESHKENHDSLNRATCGTFQSTVDDFSASNRALLFQINRLIKDLENRKKKLIKLKESIKSRTGKP